MATDTEDLNPNVPTEAAEEEGSLRDDLEAAFQAESTSDEPPTQRERDELGRFAPKTEAEAKPTEPTRKAQEAPQTASPGQSPTPATGLPPAPPPDALKAPSSWRPDAREKWATVAPEIQGEIHRREHELQHVLQQSAQARQFLDAFERTVSPYQVFIRAENSTPLQAMDNLMQTAALLRTGSTQQKVGVVGHIIKQFGIDIDMLDKFLASNLQQMPGGQQQQAPQQQLYDPRLDALLQQQQQMMYAQQQRDAQELDDGLRAFASDPKHEFFDDVRQTMGDLIELAGRQNKILPVEQAYIRACQLDETVSKILSQRESASQRGSLSQAALRAKRAARSVKGDSTPHGATVPTDDSLRSTIEAAFEANSES